MVKSSGGSLSKEKKTLMRKRVRVGKKLPISKNNEREILKLGNFPLPERRKA